ncbi:MAG: SGNH/GDSL hydrolase family protein [Chthoniobacteraceae bacterium]
MRIHHLLVIFLLLSSAWLPGQARAEGLQPNDVVVVCGDSITEQRRYSVMIEDYLLMCQPAPHLQVVQMGWNGETATGFLARMKNDALPFHPTVVTTCFGMNDGGYEPMDSERSEKYRHSMDALVNEFKKAGVSRMVVGSPGVVDPDTHKKSDPAVRNRNLAALKAVAEAVAGQNGVPFANVHDVMMDVMTKAKAQYGHTYSLAGIDGVHPSRNGHLIMAYAFLKALKCPGEIGVISYDMKSDRAEATEGHKVLAASGGSLEIESSKYPFCLYGAPSDPDGTRGISEFFPFNEDLNRFLLVVKNSPTPKVKVTWGGQTKAFDAAALSKGINLAAEFPDNPFSQPFAAVEQKIREQQDYEVIAVKSLLHSLIAWNEQVPEFAEQYGRQALQVVAKSKNLREKAQAAVVPVKHRLVIQPAD